MLIGINYEKNITIFSHLNNDDNRLCWLHLAMGDKANQGSVSFNDAGKIYSTGGNKIRLVNLGY